MKNTDKEADKKTEVEIKDAPVAAKKEPVYVFTSNGLHDGKEFKKGQEVKAGSDLIKLWLSHGVVVAK